MGSTEDDLARAQREAQELARELQDYQERLQLIQQAANIGIFEWNIQTGLVTWTRQVEELYGLPAGSFGGSEEAWEQSVHPDDLPLARAKLFESVEQKTNLDMQFRVIWPDQSIRWIYAKARTLYDPHGQPLRMLGINIDITDRKEYEEELHKTEKKLRLFAESDAIGFVFADMYGHISYVNDAFLHLIGYSRAEIMEKGVRWTDITPPEWLSVDQQMIEEARQKGTATLYEKQYFHKNGSRVDALVGFLLMDDEKEQGIAFALDITERKRLERQKDEFIGVVSHELRTPVTSLKVFAQVMQKRFSKSGDSQNAELLAKMEAQVDKLTKLIGDLIDVTKVEAGKLELRKKPFDLALLIDEVTEEMQRTTTRHTLIKDGSAEYTIQGDRDRIGQVLTNLLSNAIKYSPQADTILIKTSSDSEQVIVSVQDFGMGIPLKQQGQIFQRFYRVQEKELETISGLGLGLYISAEMIKRHKGKIWFESAPGAGSTFSFSLPLPKKEHTLPLKGDEEA